MDGHGSHMYLQLRVHDDDERKQCRSNLPATTYATHWLQPADKSLFKSLKGRSWKEMGI